jgi:putative DNA primase/helicase
VPLGKEDLAALIVQLQSLPDSLKARKQWLLWRFELYEGDKKPRKVPYYATGRKRHGGQGNKEDLAQLVVFDVAVAQLQTGRYEGIGFAFLPGDGLIGVDIDGAIDPETGEVSELCQSAIAACASYTEVTPSGRGVHIIAAGETRTFKDNGIGLEVYCGSQFFTFTGRQWSGTPTTVEPLTPQTLAQLRTWVDEAKASRRKPTARMQAPAPEGSAAELLAKLEGALGALSADLGYEDWLHVGQGLKAALGDAGFRLFDYWSSKGTKYPGEEALRRKWASFQGAGVTEATIFRLAMDAGWKPPRRKASRASLNESPPVEAYEGDVRPSRRQPQEGGQTPPPDSVREAASAGEGADLRAEIDKPKLLRTSEGGLKDCRENVFWMLMHQPEVKGLVAFDEFSHRILKMRAPPWASSPGEWTTTDDYELGFWLAQKQRLTIKAEATLVAGVAMAAHRAKFHPVRDYLAGLTWDGVDRLAFWLHECLGAADSDYTRLVGKFFILGMVNRVLNPGCQMDNMIVLEGGQGKGKSTALRILVGDEWFADTPIRIGDKDALLNLAGKWLYEIGELDAFNKAEVTAVKQYVSSRVDRVREPFARRPVDRPRSGVFAGSTNQHEYFKDPTGSRRFWPVAADGEIDLAKLREWRDQLFAEAMVRLSKGERYHPSREELKKYIEPEQEKREIQDPWFERIAQWVDSEGQLLTTSYTSSEILSGALHVPADRIDNARQMATRVGIAMRKLGWDKVRDATGARLWRYIRPGTKPKGEISLKEPTGGPADAAWGPDSWEAGNAPDA